MNEIIDKDTKQNDKTEKKKKRLSYGPAPEAEQVIRDLIGTIHTSLVDCRLKVQFRYGGWLKKGEIVASSTKKLSPEVAAATGFDFVVTINADEFWNRNDASVRRGEVDHALCHIMIGEGRDAEGRPKWLYIDHDVADFAAVARRNGEYNDGIRRMKLALNGEDDRQPLRAVV